jgi:hypothetical protein
MTIVSAAPSIAAPQRWNRDRGAFRVFSNTGSAIEWRGSVFAQLCGKLEKSVSILSHWAEIKRVRKGPLNIWAR